MKKRLTILPLLLGLAMCARAHAHPPLRNTRLSAYTQEQQNLIKGRVMDDLNQPLPGVSVANLTTEKSTQTDSKGNFALEGSVGQELKFSMVGYQTQTLKLQNTTPIITLNATDEALNEVVIVGYGQQKKVNLTGAVAQIDSKVLQDRPVSNATQALQGAVPNLNINFTNGRPGGGKG